MTRKWSIRLATLFLPTATVGCSTTPTILVSDIPLYPETIIASQGVPPTPIVVPTGSAVPAEELPRPAVESSEVERGAVKMQPGSTPALPLPAPVIPTGESSEPPTAIEVQPPVLPAPDLMLPAELFTPEVKTPAPERDVPAPEIIQAATPVGPLAPGQTHGQAADFRWLAGILDHHARGDFWTLRYADSATDDRWGGKVKIINDEHLQAFASGDHVYVEGELLAPAGGIMSAGAIRSASYYPSYRVTSVERLESANR